MTVKAIRIHKIGGPEVLQFEDVEVGSPKAGEVRIRHHAIGLNFIDIYFRTGLYPAPQLPFIPGSEAAGEVVALGSGVTQLEVGDRVAYCTGMGAYTQERVIEARHLVKLPKAISYEQGAAMMLKGLTAQYLLRTTFRVKKGDVILVHAAAGGVGLLLCQWAFALGATVIGTVSSPAKAKLARKAGARHVIDYSKEDFVEQVKKITKGAKCDVVYDGVGKATFLGSLDCLKPLGTMVTFGNASGAVDPISPSLLTQKGSLFLTRPTLANHVATHEDLVKRSRELFKAVASGIIKIDMHSRVPLADAAKAQIALAERATTAATVLIP
ncbi:MAG: quinone oxidoreductase [Hyphomicrobiales bacterium]|nr:quinone oxidoreductase [Hyphomicrobiales bacterium]MDE2115247.1 quinone oxidoreductase [Hyphomicrobiales bacterium]